LKQSPFKESVKAHQLKNFFYLKMNAIRKILTLRIYSVFFYIKQIEEHPLFSGCIKKNYNMVAKRKVFNKVKMLIFMQRSFVRMLT